MRVHFIAVGVGDSILIDYGENEIDRGNWATIAWKYVKDLIRDPIELVVVTRGDTDHWKGLTLILGIEASPKTPRFRAVEFFLATTATVDQACRDQRCWAGIGRRLASF